MVASMGRLRAEGGVAQDFGVPGFREDIYSLEADGVTGGGARDSQKEAGDPAPGTPHSKDSVESEKKGRKGPSM